MEHEPENPCHPGESRKRSRAAAVSSVPVSRWRLLQRRLCCLYQLLRIRSHTAASQQPHNRSDLALSALRARKLSCSWTSAARLSFKTVILRRLLYICKHVLCLPGLGVAPSSAQSSSRAVLGGGAWLQQSFPSPSHSSLFSWHAEESRDCSRLALRQRS